MNRHNKLTSYTLQNQHTLLSITVPRVSMSIAAQVVRGR